MRRLTIASACKGVGCYLGLLLFATGPGYAADLLPQPGTWAVGVRSGYSTSTRKLDMVPVQLRIGYTVLKGKWWVLPEGALEIAAEPFVSAITRVTSPGSRSGSVEAGVMLPMFTYSLHLGSRLYPYIEGGIGALYHDIRGYGLGGGFSFAETVGGGLSYFLDDRLMLAVGYRFRHMSNAGIYDDNTALNSHMVLAGFSYFFPSH
ncbi:MAG: acyloxyacyl hydrolase [Candidatus Binatia bacterium]|nr:acyloxyacyl hydrolase [Candidatus Binatia bacterium]